MLVSKRAVSVVLATSLALAGLAVLPATAANAVDAGTATISGTLKFPADADPSVDLWEVIGGVLTDINSQSVDPDGSYSFDVLEVGTYSVSFSDDNDHYLQTFYGGVKSEDGTDPAITTFAIAVNQLKTGVDAELKLATFDGFTTPVISGKRALGETLEVDSDGWPDSSSFDVQWLRNGAAIGGGTDSTYDIVKADLGTTISAKLVASADGYANRTIFTNSLVIPLGAFKSVKPTIKGIAAVGKTVRVSTGTWKPVKPTFTYQWLANNKVIKKATKLTFKITSAQKGKKLSVKVTATSAGFKAKVLSSKTVKITK